MDTTAKIDTYLNEINIGKYRERQKAKAQYYSKQDKLKAIAMVNVTYAVHGLPVYEDYEDDFQNIAFKNGADTIDTASSPMGTIFVSFEITDENETWKTNKSIEKIVIDFWNMYEEEMKR